MYMLDKEASNGGMVMHCCFKCTGSGFHQDFFFLLGTFYATPTSCVADPCCATVRSSCFVSISNSKPIRL